jgi:hypothetical protein
MSILAALAAAALLNPTAVDLSWMSGYWLTCEDGQEVSETWSDPRGGLMAGHGVTLARGRASFEMFRIASYEGGVAYFAQPGGRPPVIFPATEVTPTRAVFVNPGNDFPQRITYTLEGDRLTARIDGQMNGQPQGMEWRYRKAELNARCPA